MKRTIWFLLGVVVCTSSKPLPSRAPFLPNWMGHFSPVFVNQTILDITLPGTHDSLTSDLSEIFSNHANDIPEALAWLLHEFGSFVPTVGAFGRNQSKTQGLNITEQLDAGIRFIDFRIQYTNKPFRKTSDFYCLHFMQSKRRAIEYLQAVRWWLNAHPKEIVVIWVSKHGSQCADQEYAATVDERFAWWQSVESVFEGILLDRTVTPLNETTIGELQERSSRVVMFVADYENMTKSSPKAYDSCFVDNRLGGGDANNVNAALHESVAEFKGAKEHKAQDKAQNKFYLYSMASSATTKAIEYAALVHYLHDSSARKDCAAALNIPGVDQFCPVTLQSQSQMVNYYGQHALEIAHESGYEFPNAIYIDAVDKDGTIRTGTDVFGSVLDDDGNAPLHDATKYAYVATLLASNLRRVCNMTKTPKLETVNPSMHNDCEMLYSRIDSYRRAYPFSRWNDTSAGRRSDWPQL